MAKLFWSAPGAAEGQESAAVTPSAGPDRQAAAFVEGTDLLYPAPGGGLLRVPAGGGSPAELSGDAAGQLAAWSAASGQWERSTDAPAEGEVPVWNATTERWDFVPRVGVTADQVDHFQLGQPAVTGTNTAPLVGGLGWQTIHDTTTGSADKVTSEAGHPGILLLSSATTGRQAMYLGSPSNAEAFTSPENIDFLEWVARWRSERVNLGWGSDPQASNLGNDGVLVQGDPSINANWRILGRQGGATTVIISSVAVSALVWVTWRIQRVSATVWRVFADGVLEGELDGGGGDNVPATAIMPIAQCVAVGGATGSVDIDSFYYKSRL